MISENSILGLELFSDNIRNSLIFHIPHSSVNIPDRTGYLIDYESEIIKLTDYATEQLFDIEGTKKVIANFSRIFCDVERFYPDSLEDMSKYGRGFYYTKTDDGSELRSENPSHKEIVLNEFYIPYHNRFTEVVTETLDSNGIVTIIDCHSFNDKPLLTDIDQSEPRPDICIGIDKFHTPDFLLDMVKCQFENNGYYVKINSPYSGTIVPEKYYNIDKRINSIMIEINKKLYMNSDDSINPQSLFTLNKLINSIFEF